MEKMTFEQVLERDGKLVYTNKGDSMMPLIKEGRDLVVIVPASGRLKKYDVPLYKRDNGKYVLHRVLKVLPDGYVICGDNRWRREYGITDRHVIGVLSAVVRNGKVLKTTDLRYRIYVHVRCDLFYVRAAIFRVRGMLKKIYRKIK